MRIFILWAAAGAIFPMSNIRTDVGDAVRESVGDVPSDLLRRFTDKIYYIVGDYEQESFYKSIAARLTQLDKEHNVGGSRIFYMAVPPLLYGTIVKGLDSAGLSCPGLPGCERIRIVVEKPFGSDLKSANELN